MREIEVMLGEHDPDALKAELQAAFPGRVHGFSGFGPTRPALFYVDDDITAAEETEIARLALAHKPPLPPQPIARVLPSVLVGDSAQRAAWLAGLNADQLTELVHALVEELAAVHKRINLISRDGK